MLLTISKDRRILISAALFLIAGCTQHAAVATKVSRVQFYVSDEYGQALDYTVSEFYDTAGKRGEEALFRNTLRADGIRHGVYKYRLVPRKAKAPHASVIQGSIAIRHPEHWLTVEPSGFVRVNGDGNEVIADMDGAYAQDLEGSVLGLPALGGAVWVRLQAFPGSFQTEAAIDKNGRFSFYEVTPGWYVLLLIHDGHVLQAEPLLIPDQPRLRKVAIRYKPAIEGGTKYCPYPCTLDR